MVIGKVVYEHTIGKFEFGRKERKWHTTGVGRKQIVCAMDIQNQ